MAKFLDKKERVIDFQLTSFGKHRLSVGKLAPAYYAFFDTGVLYDSEYAGFEEVQTKINERIKTETQFLEGILMFEEAENTVPESEWIGTFDSFAISPGAGILPDVEDAAALIRAGEPEYAGMTAAEIFLSPEKVAIGYEYYEFSESLFDLDVTPKKVIPTPNILSFDSSIGDARFEGDNTQAAPAWKLLTCQGEINTIKQKDTARYNFTGATFDHEIVRLNIPQINITSNYTLEVSSPGPFMAEEVPSDFFDETQAFADGNSIKLKRNDVVLYAEEVNTQLLTENFDVEVYEMIEDTETTVLASATTTIVDQVNVGDTVTLSDGISTVIFEFIDNTSADVARAAGFGPGRVGVIRSDNYKILDVNYNRKGSIYNLISAIRQDGGYPSLGLGYPTLSRYGTDADGTENKNKGRCHMDEDAPVGCYVGRHNLKIDLSNPEEIISSIKGSSLPFAITLANNNTTQGDPNKTIATNAPDSRITVDGFSGGYTAKGTELKRLYFSDETQQIVDGFMVSETEGELATPDLTEDSVEYYFKLLTDKQVDAKIACSCASTFNRDSYYIDIDFDCVEEKELEKVYYDIYGSATSPEICNLPSPAASTPFDRMVEDTGADDCEDE